jgi:hypothetical protein
MDGRAGYLATFCLLTTALLGGCNSPYHADRGALFGGLLGAGTGAVVGSALHNPGAGAAIGAGVGALTGAAVGSEMDEIEARNRALIEQKLGRQVVAGAVTIDEVLAMTRAGVDEELIVNHIRAHGMAAPLQSGDLIMLQQQNISKRVIATMQASPPRPVAAAAYPYPPPPQPVVVEQYYYDPFWGPHWHPHYYRPCRPGVSFEFR